MQVGTVALSPEARLDVLPTKTSGCLHKSQWRQYFPSCHVHLQSDRMRVGVVDAAETVEADRRGEQAFLNFWE